MNFLNLSIKKQFGCIYCACFLLFILSGFVVLTSSVFASEQIKALKTIDLGLLGQGVKLLEIKVKVENKSVFEDFKIKQVKGECSCFIEAIHDPILFRSSDTIIKLRFNLEKFRQAAKWNSIVAIEFEGANGSFVHPIQMRTNLITTETSVLVPTRGFVEVQEENHANFGKSNTVKVFVLRHIASSIDIRISKVPNLIQYSIEKSIPEPQVKGDFVEFAHINYKIDPSTLTKTASEHFFVIELTGAISANHVFYVDVFKPVKPR